MTLMYSHLSEASAEARLWCSNARIQHRAVRIVCDLSPYHVMPCVLRTQSSLLCQVLYDQQTVKVMKMGDLKKYKPLGPSVCQAI